tara:strand:- start:130 stop:303 length:174 start_codon:yes stop_codon:yes gene_type:complete
MLVPLHYQRDILWKLISKLIIYNILKMQYNYLKEIEVFKIIYSNVLVFIEKNPNTLD